MLQLGFGTGGVGGVRWFELVAVDTRCTEGCVCCGRFGDFFFFFHKERRRRDRG